MCLRQAGHSTDTDRGLRFALLNKSAPFTGNWKDSARNFGGPGQNGIRPWSQGVPTQFMGQRAGNSGSERFAR